MRAFRSASVFALAVLAAACAGARSVSLDLRPRAPVIKGGEKVLDLGTGSGILAIICKKLGAGEIDAVDIDKLAVDVAVDNCEINGCPDIDCYVGELKDVKSSDYDIIVANIIADVIAAIACDIPSRLAQGGKFICSGIINTKKDKVEKALAEAGFKILRVEEKNDWMAYECVVG